MSNPNPENVAQMVEALGLSKSQFGTLADALGVNRQSPGGALAVLAFLGEAARLCNPPNGANFDKLFSIAREVLAWMPKQEPTALDVASWALERAAREARAVILNAGGMIGPYGVVLPLPLPMACFGKVGKAGGALGFSRVDGNLSDMMRAGLGSVLVLTNNESAPKWMEQLRRGARPAEPVHACGAPDAPSDGSPEEQDGC
jgi:hypothetical protein